MENKRPAILHISYDINYSNSADRTTAVSNLVNQGDKFARNIIISLNRVSKKQDELTKVIKDDVLHINSAGYPYGIFHKRHLKNSFSRIIKADEEGLTDLSSVNLIHAHKSTFDGYIGFLFAEKLNVPLFLTLRQTDFDVFKYRPDLKPTYKKVLQKSSRIFYLVPIMISLIRNSFGDEFFRDNIEKKLVYLPNIVDNFPEQFHEKTSDDAPLLTILRMTKRSVKRKNIRNLLKALRAMENEKFILQIAGGGDYTQQVKQWVEDYGLSGKVKFLGQIPNSRINEYYAGAKAFLMPSFSESFGLVYAESLLNGTPIMYAKDVIGFDGVFEGVGAGVNPWSVESIKNGIIDLIKNNRHYRENISRLNREGAFNIFSSQYAAETYQKACSSVLDIPVQIQEI